MGKGWWNCLGQQILNILKRNKLILTVFNLLYSYFYWKGLLVEFCALSAKITQLFWNTVHVKVRVGTSHCSIYWAQNILYFSTTVPKPYREKAQQMFEMSFVLVCTFQKEQVKRRISPVKAVPTLDGISNSPSIPQSSWGSWLLLIYITAVAQSSDHGAKTSFHTVARVLCKGPSNTQ